MPTNPQTQKEKDSVKNAHAHIGQSTVLHLPIAEIRDDVIILKNGGIRAVLETSTINFNLKSEEEQNSIIYSYQHFLNTLEFPIQILIRSRKLNIDEYINKMREKAKTQSNPLLKKQTIEYADYIQKLIEYADIMEKSFYIIVPFNPLRANNTNIFSEFLARLKTKDNVAEIRKRQIEFEQLHKGLIQRVNLIKAGLQNCGLTSEQLKTTDLIKLLYNVYNPISSRYQNINNLEDFSLEMKI
ncbi:MAG: Type IV secretory pathway VirB4 protein [Candidatus Peregrinibacteria bacterium GW2011_GWF2_33_10]|nr:MAG: Type IV secretory pathway VirB4 protein [Candidatus Peregrinibacteria bacterium GW2011_GWF2_33_10]